MPYDLDTTVLQNNHNCCGVNRQSQGPNPRPKAKGEIVLTTKPYGRRAVELFVRGEVQVPVGYIALQWP